MPLLKLTPVATGLSSPVLIKAAPGDATRLYILEQTGRIKILKNGSVLGTPFLDIDTSVQTGGEQGLLGLAFHPNYAQNRRFFVFYTANNGNQRVVEFARSSGNPELADVTPVKTLLDLPDPESNHNGGTLEFSPVDGYLYVGLGDGGGGGDQHGAFGNGENLATLWGKIVRLDVDSSTQPYGIPAGNMTAIPFGNRSTSVMGEIWDYGLRNPWRMSFDACTGDLYMGDVGQGSYEEVDVEPAGQGRNSYGWSCREGKHAYNSGAHCQDGGVPVEPVAEYSHAASRCSITGGYVYRGSAIPALRGTYFYGDYCTGDVWSLVWANGLQSGPTSLTADLTSPGSISSFGQDLAGEVYVVAYGSGSNGAIYRVDPE